MSINDSFDNLLNAMQGESPPEAPPPMPTGGDFTPTGFIGPLNARIRWVFGTYTDLSGYEELPECDTVTFNSGWTKYYFGSNDAAEAGQKIAGEGYVEQVWRVEMDATRILNARSADFAEKWRGVVANDVKLASIKSYKNRWQYQLVALPAFVDAMARATGLIEESIFTLDELIEPPSITDEFQAQMIGVFERDADWLNTELGKRRAALWAALGEDNPEAYCVIGAGTEYDTTSETLSRVLSLIRVERWATELWCRAIFAKAPFPGASKFDDVLIIKEIFANEAAAQEVATAELAESGATPTNTPPVPAAWAEVASEWPKELSTLKAEYGDELPAKPKLIGIAKDLDAEVADVEAWWPLV